MSLSKESYDKMMDWSNKIAALRVENILDLVNESKVLLSINFPIIYIEKMNSLNEKIRKLNHLLFHYYFTDQKCRDEIPQLLKYISISYSLLHSEIVKEFLKISSNENQLTKKNMYHMIAHLIRDKLKYCIHLFNELKYDMDEMTNKFITSLINI